MELTELIQNAEQENEALSNHGEISPDSYRTFKELIEGIKKYIHEEKQEQT